MLVLSAVTTVVLSAFSRSEGQRVDGTLESNGQSCLLDNSYQMNVIRSFVSEIRSPFLKGDLPPTIVPKGQLRIVEVDDKAWQILTT